MFIKKRKNKIGFTLIELLIVIAVIAVLSSLVFVALNPLARFQDSRNAKRWSDVNAILSAIKLHQIDHGGLYDETISDLSPNLYYQIGEDDEGNCADACTDSNVSLQDDCVDLDNFVSGEYLLDIPIDPNATGASYNETRYYIMKNENNIITVGACSVELGSASSIQNISVSK